MVSLSVFLPGLFGLLLLLGAPRLLGVIGAAASLLLNLWLFIRVAEGGVLLEKAPLLREVGVYYAMGLDGVSALLFLSTALVVFLGSLSQVEGRFLGLALLMSTGLLGIFAARDLVLFYVFFEATLIPALFMLLLYGREERLRALYTFVLFTLAGSLPMLAAILAVRYLGGAESFLLEDLLAKPVPEAYGKWVFLGFLIAFAVKTPLVPLHAWLPLFHRENHPSGLADALGTLYKVGLYAFFRYAIPLAPSGFSEWQGLLLFLSALGAVYGAWVAFSAKDWKTLLAYGGISHMGLGGLGLFSGIPEGITGSLFLLAASAVYTGGLFLFAGFLHQRTNTLEIGLHRGLAASAPGLSVLGLFLVMTMVGLPGLSGFPGELLSLLGAYKASPWLAAFGFLAVIGSAAYALTAFQKVFWETSQKEVHDLTPHEWAFAGLSVLALLWMGLFPGYFMRGLTPLAEALAKLLGGGA
ncbi:MAG: complex I subunit 4 family protein [Thermaceae bacterium]